MLVGLISLAISLRSLDDWFDEGDKKSKGKQAPWEK